MTRHERGVGAVRFCPVKKKGQVHLATSADDSIIIIWKLEEGRAPMQMIGEESCYKLFHQTKKVVSKNIIRDPYYKYKIIVLFFD